MQFSLLAVHTVLLRGIIDTRSLGTTGRPANPPNIRGCLPDQADRVGLSEPRAGNIGAYKLEVCPGTKRAGACKAASPDRCKEWHVCYLCVKAGKVAAECFSHPAGPQCPEFVTGKEKGAKYRRK